MEGGGKLELAGDQRERESERGRKGLRRKSEKNMHSEVLAALVSKQVLTVGHFLEWRANPGPQLPNTMCTLDMRYGAGSLAGRNLRGLHSAGTSTRLAGGLHRLQRVIATYSP